MLTLTCYNNSNAFDAKRYKSEMALDWATEQVDGLTQAVREGRGRPQLSASGERDLVSEFPVYKRPADFQLSSVL